jgi:hypothetical protein
MDCSLFALRFASTAVRCATPHLGWGQVRRSAQARVWTVWYTVSDEHWVLKRF